MRLKPVIKLESAFLLSKQPNNRQNEPRAELVWRKITPQSVLVCFCPTGDLVHLPLSTVLRRGIVAATRPGTNWPSSSLHIKSYIDMLISFIIDSRPKLCRPLRLPSVPAVTRSPRSSFTIHEITIMTSEGTEHRKDSRFSSH